MASTTGALRLPQRASAASGVRCQASLKASQVQAVKAAAKRYLSQGNAAIKSDDWAEF